jgi:hypothetical protein
MEPTFTQIWDNNEWELFAPDAKRSRRYFKARSLIRMTVWIPFFVGCFYMFIGAVSVFE